MAIDGRPIESDTFSFVVRIWYEDTGSESHLPCWRGSIEHVGPGQRRYFVNLDEISRYIQDHVGPLDERGMDTAPAGSHPAAEAR